MPFFQKVLNVFESLRHPRHSRPRRRRPASKFISGIDLATGTVLVSENPRPRGSRTTRLARHCGNEHVCGEPPLRCLSESRLELLDQMRVRRNLKETDLRMKMATGPRRGRGNAADIETSGLITPYAVVDLLAYEEEEILFSRFERHFSPPPLPPKHNAHVRAAAAAGTLVPTHHRVAEYTLPRLARAPSLTTKALVSPLMLRRELVAV
ncbi:MC023L [Molluscum contagiosum virus]|uniref:MC023L n=1 Tax=Molluscum contagiosum virus TaxID=10279 RepID=A0A3T0CZX9_9POXV|nr:MC023L [Molluscum contagiosum virus]